jgi:benzodiazapine receptor
MDQDRRRQVVTLATYLVTVAVNGAANALPINGQTTASISDRFEVLVIPAGYVFAIWGLIYALLGAFSIDQARPSRAADPTLRRLGYLPAMTGALNTVWLLLFQYEVFVLTVPVMIGLLVSLIAINAVTFADRDHLAGPMRWTIRAPFSVYLGWITVATIANIAQTLKAIGFDGFGIDPPIVAGGVLVVGLAIAVTFVWRFADSVYGSVIVWAYVGIAVKESATTIVPVVSLAGATVVGALLLTTMALGRRATAMSMVGVRPSTPWSGGPAGPGPRLTARRPH